MTGSRRSDRPDISRRRLLAGGGVALAATATVAAGCDAFSTAPKGSGGGAGSAGGDGASGGGAGASGNGPEAPALRAQVRAGKLPPVKKRLPDKPLVVQPTKSVGRYGGGVRNVLLSTDDGSATVFRMTYENLVRWTQDWTGKAGTDEIIPNVAESFEVNADSSKFTFRLRRGMRWSDGEPFTVDDVVFAVNDVLLNKDINPIAPTVLTVDKGVAKIEKLDDYSFVIAFPATSGLFLKMLATSDGTAFTHYPRHYLEQFHKDYNPKVDQLAHENHVSDWIQLFTLKGDDVVNNPDLPSLAAWQVTRSFAVGDHQLALERNPYYWKVDSKGSQLPYIDEVVFEQVSDPAVLLLKALNGEDNLELTGNTRFTSLANKPVLARNRDKGQYRFYDLQDTRMNVMIIYLNFNIEDQVKRKIFWNRDFRIGLSYAINRQELLKATMQGKGAPFQVAPLPESPFYDEELALQYTEHDKKKANEHLDKAFPQRDQSGKRIGPDGKPINFTLEFVSDFRAEWADMVQLVQRYWREVGVDANLKNETRDAMLDRTAANRHDATIWQGDAGMSMFVAPDYYIGTQEYYAPTWGEWYYSKGKDGTEPAPAPKRQMHLYDQIKATGDPAEQTRLMKEILQIDKEQFYLIGTVRETQKYAIVGDGVRNLPAKMLEGWDYPTPGPCRPEQFYIET